MVKDPANGSESGCDMPQPSENILVRAWSKGTRRTSRAVPDSAQATSGLNSIAHVIHETAEVTRRTPSTMPISPPPSFIPTRQAPLPPATVSQSISEDEATGRKLPLTMPILPPPIFYSNRASFIAIGNAITVYFRRPKSLQRLS